MHKLKRFAENVRTDFDGAANCRRSHWTHRTIECSPKLSNPKAFEQSRSGGSSTVRLDTRWPWRRRETEERPGEPSRSRRCGAKMHRNQRPLGFGCFLLRLIWRWYSTLVLMLIRRVPGFARAATLVNFGRTLRTRLAMEGA